MTSTGGDGRQLLVEICIGVLKFAKILGKLQGKWAAVFFGIIYEINFQILLKKDIL